MEQLLNKASTISMLAFLRMLQLVHIQVSNLVEDLKELELESLAPRSQAESTELRRSIGGLSASSSTTNLTATVSLSSMLESSVEELFVPYTEGTRYLERESKSLGDLYMNYLTRFSRYHVRRLIAFQSLRYELYDVERGQQRWQEYHVRPYGQPT